ncbi:MAG: hypothetical protein FOGNACKC_01340 [Anaerolineae bacterium]|nr:hypothetical protein [Anaerolineae bacterium]
MFSYIAYGLRIQSVVPLPELIPDATVAGQYKTDVMIRFGKINPASLGPKQAFRQIYADNQLIRLSWPGIGLFLIRNGREIIIDPAPGVDECVLRLFILGSTLAMLLHQRGDTAVLHASTVAIAGQAIAFVGAKGAGKSTMAATLYQRGHTLLTDDILAINLGSARPMVLPGYPHLKLWPDTIASMGHRPESLPRLRPELEKRGYRVANRFASTPVPLKGIFVLGRGPELKIEPLRPHDALINLLPHWYGARFGPDLLQALGVSTHFQQCVALVKQVSICGLESPDHLPALPEVARCIEHHVKEKKFDRQVP